MLCCLAHLPYPFQPLNCALPGQVRRGHDVRNWLAVTLDHNSLASFHLIKELRQLGFSLGQLHFDQVNSSALTDQLD